MPVRVTQTTPRRASLIGSASAARASSVRLEGFTRGLDQLAQLALVTRDRRERSILTKELTNFRLETLEQMDAAGDAFTGAGDFAEPFTNSVRERAGAAAAKFNNPRIEQRFKDAVESELPSIFRGAQVLEQARTEQFLFNNARETALATNNLVLNDPASRDAARERIGELGETLPPQLRDKFVAQQHAEIDENFIDGRIQQDPYAFRRELQEGAFNDEIESRQLRSALRRVDAEINRREAEAERRNATQRAVRSFQLRGLIADDLASLEATGQGLSEEPVSVDEVAEVLGPDAAARFESARETAAASFAAIDGIEDDSPALINERLERLRPQPGQQNFSEQQKIFERAQAAASRELASRAADPAGHFLAADPELQALAATFQDAAAQGLSVQGAIFDRLARRQEARQAAGGVPAFARRVLPQGQAKALVAQTLEGDPSRRAQRLRDLAGSLDARFGESADRVLDELVTAGLPQEAQILRALGDDPAASTRVARALDQKKDIEKQIDKFDRDKIASRVDRELAPFLDTLMQASNGAALSNSYRETMEATANYLVVVEGMSPKKAAEEAARPFNESYTFFETYRVPKGFDAGAVERGAAAELARLVDGGRGSGLAPNAGDARLTEDQRRVLYADVVAQGAAWITNDDESGLILVDDFGRPVIAADGAPVARGFDELVATAPPRRVGAALLPLSVR